MDSETKDRLLKESIVLLGNNYFEIKSTIEDMDSEVKELSSIVKSIHLKRQSLITSKAEISRDLSVEKEVIEELEKALLFVREALSFTETQMMSNINVIATANFYVICFKSISLIKSTYCEDEVLH